LTIPFVAFVKKHDFIVKGLQSFPRLSQLAINSLPIDELQLLLEKLPKLSFLNNQYLEKPVPHGKKSVFAAPPSVSSKHHITFNEFTAQQNQEDQTENQEAILDNDDGPLTLLFDCIGALFKEKNSEWEVQQALNPKLKIELYDFCGALNDGMSEEELEAVNMKAEASINWSILKLLSKYIKDYGDQRLAMIMDTIIAKNRTIEDHFFNRLKENSQILTKLKFLRREVHNLSQENQSLKFRLQRMAVREQSLAARPERRRGSSAKERPESPSEITAREGHLQKTEGDSAENKQSEEITSSRRLMKSPKSGTHEKNSDGNVKANATMTSTSKQTFMNTLTSAKANESRLILPSQLKSVINDLFISKMKKNKSCLLAEIPLRTMREHLEVSFTDKFGIKKLIVESLQSFIHSLREFESQDIEFFVFDKILSSNLPEEFMATLHQMRQTLKSTYFLVFASQNATVPRKEISELFAKSLRGFIQEKDALAVIKLLYGDSDCEFLVPIIKRVSEKVSTAPNKLRRMKDSPAPEFSIIKYNVFEHIITRYIVEKQVVYLENTTRLFQTFDLENEGKLSEEQFIRFLDRISEIISLRLDKDEIMMRLDPAKTEVFNYSQVISYFVRLFVKAESSGRDVCVIQLINYNANLS